MDWQKELPATMVDKAFKVPSGEMAWPRGDALEAIKFLEEKGFLVGSVEVWAAGEAGPLISSAFVYNWDLELAQKQGARPKTAREFVETFKWQANDPSFGKSQPLFNIYAEAT